MVRTKLQKKQPDMETLVIDDCVYKTTFTKKFRNRKKYEPKDPKQVMAFIPGLIKDIFVKEEQEVNEGERLITLEAMKMVNDVFAPITGKIKKIWVRVGENVTREQLLVEFE
jgi:biotin carboxyl carrier protein